MTILQQSKKNPIGKRLKTVAALAAVRLYGEKSDKKLTAIDVGTDHAKLPIYLIDSGEFSHVTATDINEGPVNTARKNIALSGKLYSDSIDVVKTDGLTGLSHLRPDRILIAGMGGELIRDILKNAEFVRREKRKIMFVLQPQSRENLLRKHLYDWGYEILDEVYVSENRKDYSVISCIYDGIPRKYSLMDLYFGKKIYENPTEEFLKYITKKYSILKTNTEKRKASGNASNLPLYAEEEALLSEMEAYLEGGVRKCL